MKKMLIVLTLALAAGAAAGYYLYNKPAEVTVSREADYRLTSKALADEFEADEDKANEKYLNKVITVEGKITEIGSQGGNTLLLLEGGAGMASVSCEVPGDLARSAGEKVTVKGLCTGMLMDVVLVKCTVE